MLPASFEVKGIPQPKGSLAAVPVRVGAPCRLCGERKFLRVWMKESNADTLARWRSNVRAASLEAIGLLRHPGPVAVTITFWLAKPKSARRGLTLSTKKPDIDKLARAALDALTDAHAYLDDAQVVDLTLRKRYVSVAHAHPGALIEISEVTE